MRQRGETPPGAPSSAAIADRGFLSGWYRLTAPPEPQLGAGFDQRERARRGRLASTLLLLVLILWGLSAPEALRQGGESSLAVFLGGLLVIGAALFLNRSGGVSLVAWLLIAAIDAGTVLIVLRAHSRLDELVIPVFDLLVYSVLIAVSLLPPASVFLVALGNSLFIAGAVLLSPRTPEVDALLRSGHVDGILVQPITLQIAVAVVTYLWVRSALHALRRADRAEEVALLEMREVERTRELDEGVRQLLDVHVRLANGDTRALVPPLRNAQLWQVGISLNFLIARLAHYAQAEQALRREQEEADRLAEAILQWGRGRPPLWPAPTGLPMDRVVAALRGLTGVPEGRSGRPQPDAGPWASGAGSGADPRLLPPASPVWPSEQASPPSLPAWLSGQSPTSPPSPPASLPWGPSDAASGWSRPPTSRATPLRRQSGAPSPGWPSPSSADEEWGDPARGAEPPD